MSVLKKTLKKVAKATRRILPAYYGINRESRLYYIRNWESAKIVKDTVLYEVRDGQSITDSPLTIFLYLVKHNAYNNFQHIWVVKSDINKDQVLINIPEEFQSRIKFVVRDSLAYSKWLLAANYLITNSTFNFFWHKRPGQIYINTWHGTPLKFMGYDIPGNKNTLKNVQRNLLMTDYIITPNSHTSHVFLNRYKLRGIYQGTILEAGYPRNDILQERDLSIIASLKAEGVSVDSRKIVLYTPTWKGTSITNPVGNVEQIVAEVDYLQTRHPEVQVLVKVHPYTYHIAASNQKLKKILIPDYFDANRVLSVTDILITDYSSIFFDFEITKRPILFYTWDKEQYDYYRGMYLDDNQLPGKVMSNISDVSDELTNLNFDQKQYNRSVLNMSSYDDGYVTERIVNRIFNQISSENITEIKSQNINHKNILIFAGGMKNNGISSSLINLTHNLDYDRLDVSVLVYDGQDKVKVQNINRLDNHVRLIYIMGTPALTVNERLRDFIISKFGMHWWTQPLYPQKGYQREVHRLIGNNEFDTVIDFSGYSYSGAKLVAEVKSKKRIIFQHNDLWADSLKVIKGKKPNYRNLNTLFSIYSKFDKVVSVSEQLMKINGRKLRKFITPEQQSYLKNTLNFDQRTDNVKQKFLVKDIDEPIVFKITKFQAALSIQNLLLKKFEDVTVGNENFRVISKISIENHEYVRLTKNGLPWVWVEADVVIFLNESNVVISEEKINKIGWIKKNSRYLWANVTTMQNNEIIGRGWLIQYTFVKIIGRVVTNRGVYVEIWLPGKKRTAYIWEGAILKLNRTNFTLIQKGWNFTSKKRTESQFEIKDQAVLVKKGTSFYAQPPGLLRQFNESAGFTSLPLQMSHARSYVNGKWYYRIGVGKDRKWISEVDVTLFNPNVQLMGYDLPLSDIVNAEESTIQIADNLYCSTKSLGEELNDHQKLVDFWMDGEHCYIPYLENSSEQVVVKSLQVVSSEAESSTLLADRISRKEVLKLINQDTVPYGNLDLVTLNPKKAVSKFVRVRETSPISNLALDKLNDFNELIKKDNFIFSSMGRFSPEKNQIMLIQAFAKVIAQNPKTFLVLLGEGPLKKDLQKLVSFYKIQDHVLFLGQVDNPLEILKRTDAFVLPSAYEGQPMVLLEAMSIGMPIVATNIAANINVLDNQNYGLITMGFSVEALAESMKNISTYQYKFKHFDPKMYNKEILDEFYKLVE